MEIGFAPQTGLTKYLLAKKYKVEDIQKTGLINDENQETIKNCLVFAIKNEDQKTVGFATESLNQTKLVQKNLLLNKNLVDQESLLYNYSNAKKHCDQEKQVFLVQGVSNVMKMHQAGFENTMGLLTKETSEKQVYKLKNLKPVLVFNTNYQESKNMLKTVYLGLKNNLYFQVVSTKNLETLEQKELSKTMAKKQDGLDYVFNLLREKVKVENPATITKLKKQIDPFLKVSDTLSRSFYGNKIKELQEEKELLTKQKEVAQEEKEWGIAF